VTRSTLCIFKNKISINEVGIMTKQQSKPCVLQNKLKIIGLPFTFFMESSNCLLWLLDNIIKRYTRRCENNVKEKMSYRY